MEPVDYVKILKNHWKVVVALVVLALAAVYVTTPKRATKAYSADAVLYMASGGGEVEGGGGFANVRLAARFVNTPPIPQNVAEELGWTGTPEQLAGKVTATADPEQLPFLTITASGSTPEEAIRIANGFADGLIAYIDQQETARLQEASDAENARIQDIQVRIAELEQQIAGNPPNVVSLRQQLDALNVQAATPPATETEADKVSYKVKETAANARTEASFIAGAGRPQRMLLGALVAAMIGFGVAIMLDRSDSRLRTKESTERHFGLPVLAEIPMLNIRDRSRAAVVAFERVPRIAESYRSLRTALLLFRGKAAGLVPATNGNGHASGDHRHLSDAGAVRQLVVVTSPEAGDGKSTTTANLAMAYAETGQSVLLVSWDLWRPLSPGVFDAQEGPGVSDYLDGHGSSLVRYVQDTSIPGVRIVTAGLGGHHPTAQLEAARRLLEEARTLANVVIVDTAPILSASVTRELVTLADAVLVVCRAGRTTVSAADRCAELLERLGAPTLGVVLVGVPGAAFNDYYGAPAKGIRRPLDRIGLGGGNRRSESPRGGRHKAPSGAPTAGAGSSSRNSPPMGSSLRPTAAQYRASSPRSGPEGTGRP
jgi:capsular exopolysaccharide synthesis family protein